MMLLWLILLSTGLIYWLFFRQSRIRLPGPRGLPILGNLLQMDTARSHLTFSKWAQKYGPIFVVHVFQESMVVVNDYESIHDVLVKRGNEFDDRGKIYLNIKVIDGDWKDIMFASASAPHWKVLRKAAHKYLKVHGAGGEVKFEELIHDAISDQMKRIASFQGKPFNVRDQFFDFAACIMNILSVGRKLEANSAEARRNREIAEAFVTNAVVAGTGFILDIFPWLRLLPNKTYSRLTKINDEVDNSWAKLMKEIETDEDHPDSFAKHMLNLKNSLKTDKGAPLLDNINIELATGNLLVAGATTTTAVISAFIAVLLHYTDVKLKLQQEVDAIVGRDDKVTVSKRDEMPYTRAAILELLRYATVATLLPHAASKDTTISGEFVPKGTRVIANLWHLHHDDVFWGDPWTYRPERYLDENGELLPADHPNRKRLLPFGAGKRVCIGELFAMNRLFLFIATLVQKFDVCRDTTKELPACDPRTYTSGGVIYPVDFTVSMVPREARDNSHK